MHAYRARLCVLQLAEALSNVPAAHVLLVDTLAAVDVRVLAEVLGPRGPVKILHDAGFDARMLRDEGVELGNVLDTAVHARFLGCRETGLGSLLAARFGVTLHKSMQQHDWGRRPLGPRERAYLAGDVTYLGMLAAQLEAEALAAGIADEVAEETAWTLRSALRADDEPRPPYARVKGARELGTASLAVLRALAAVREREAEAVDLPPGRVVSNASLLGIAKARPRSLADLGRVLPLTGPVAPIAKALVEAVGEGLAAGDIPADERRWFATERPPPDAARRRARETMLQKWRAEEATRRGVDLQVVLPGHCLHDLAAAGARDLAALAAIEGFGAVCVERYGTELVDKLRALR